MTDETRQSIIDGLFRLGAPAVILAAMLWMIREASSSVHSTILVPIVQAHTEYLDATRRTLDGIEKTQQQQAATLHEIADGQREIKAVIVKVSGTPGAQN